MFVCFLFYFFLFFEKHLYFVKFVYFMHEGKRLLSEHFINRLQNCKKKRMNIYHLLTCAFQTGPKMLFIKSQTCKKNFVFVILSEVNLADFRLDLFRAYSTYQKRDRGFS